MTKRVAWLAAVAAAVAVAGCGDDSDDGGASTGKTDVPVCGDTVCEAEETASSCAADCGCGNGKVDTGEACDASDLSGATCESEGKGDGTLACASDCTLDFSGCDGGPSCGDGNVDSGEDCDGADLGDKTCASEGGDGGTLACNANCTLDASACCDDACPSSGDSQCAAEVVETCNPSAGGCLAWVAATDCAGLGQICAVTGGEAGCSPSCTDQCGMAGDTQCNLDVVETCQVGAEGCLSWTPGTDCAATNEACDATTGTAVCVPTCVDQCPATGDTQCGGNVLQVCALGADGCLDWVADTDCSAVNQICDTSTGMPACVVPCSDQCGPAGVESCNGTITQTCELAASGCLDWTSGVDCATTSQICDASSGTAECITPCSDECPTAGEESCNGTVIVTCTLAPSGCLELSAGTDCAATAQICEESSGTATCVTPCSDQCPSVGFESCAGANVQICSVGPLGCLEWQVASTCGVGTVCVDDGAGDAGCQSVVGGESCADPIPIQAGANLVTWIASTADYLTVKPACVAVGELTGPDIVLSYTAPFDALVTLTFDNKPTDTRWVAIPSSGPCGTLVPELACISDWAPPTMGGTFPVVGGQTYFVYVRDTTSGAAPLSNPLSIQVSEADCAPTPPVAVTQFLPASGSTTLTLSPTLTVNFDGPVNTAIGVVTLTGNLSTNLAFDLATNPSQVTFSANGQTMTVKPGPLLSGETITVGWTGLVSECNKPITPPPSWSFTVVTAPCGPGLAGMVGSTATNVPTAIGALTENFAAADHDPSGYAYVGGLTTLFRVKKAGSAVENVHTLAGLTGTHLGYAMAIAGQSIFTVEAKTTGTTGHLWRISTNGGVNWSLEDYATFPQVPADDFRAATAYEDKIYLLTHEATSGALTEVWSVDAFAPSVPNVAVLEASIPGELNCSGLGVDDVNFYIACGTSTRLVRVPRATPGLTTLLTAAWPLNTTVNSVHAADTTADGLADYLYFKGGTRDVFFVCGPGGAMPYSDQLVNFGTAVTTNYGLGFDAVANRLWAHHDTTKDFVQIQ